jgi:hypothetical protein
LLLVWRFYLRLYPLLAESVDDRRQILLEHLPQLALYLSLDETLDDGDGVEGGADVDVLQGICLEDDGDTFLLRNHEDNIG